MLVSFNWYFFKKSNLIWFRYFSTLEKVESYVSFCYKVLSVFWKETKQRWRFAKISRPPSLPHRRRSVSKRNGFHSWASRRRWRRRRGMASPPERIDRRGCSSHRRSVGSKSASPDSKRGSRWRLEFLVTFPESRRIIHDVGSFIHFQVAEHFWPHTKMFNYVLISLLCWPKQDICYLLCCHLLLSSIIYRTINVYYAIKNKLTKAWDITFQNPFRGSLGLMSSRILQL